MALPPIESPPAPARSVSRWTLAIYGVANLPISIAGLSIALFIPVDALIDMSLPTRHLHIF